MGGMSYWIRRYKNADTEQEQKMITSVLKERFKIKPSDIADIKIKIKTQDYCIDCGRKCDGTRCRECFEKGTSMIAKLSRYNQKRRYRERQKTIGGEL